ncbi:hypothetical protein C0991_008969 [Blastosporella zonata]|nr:hypothetical protein C0991_008969 [Blastosporella zonata]
MAPYTTLAIEDQEKAASGRFPGPAGMFDYDLFSVINHEGKMDNGHYTNFARYQDERHLDYKVETRPTYVLARETEAVREKEKEKEKEAARMKEVEDALLATV